MPGALAGALTGALITAALLGAAHLLHTAFGLPFLPFQVFDRVARILPGGLITIGIDAMVSVIRGLSIGEMSTIAKKAEQGLAIVGMLITGVLAGAVYFRLRRGSMAGTWTRAGIVLGLVLGLPGALIAATSTQQAAGGPVGSAIWALVVCLCWGLAIAWTHARLSAATAPRPAAEPLEVMPLDRRTFMLRFAGATATIAIAGAVLSEAISRRARHMAAGARPWSATHPLPNANATVQPVPGTRRELTPVEEHYRIDINTVPPSVNEADWRLRIGGLVQQPREFTMQQLRMYEPMHQFITLQCISNPIGGDLISTTRWTGVSLQALLPDFGLQPAATHLRLHSVDGFYEVVPLDVIRADPRVMLTYAWDGLPLPDDHGFPLRIYIPDHYGMKQPKWIDRIEATSTWEPGYWVRRGWDRDARMNTTSVIDTIGSNMMIIEPGNATVVPIGGIAFAGARGISRVEVQVDGGPWQPAMLRDPLSPTTWVLWRYEWPFQAGRHTFTVRCFEGDGTPQIAEEHPIRPSGATGLVSKSQML